MRTGEFPPRSPIFPGRYTAQAIVDWRGVWLLPYWRSFVALESFSKHPQVSHLRVWKRFNPAVGARETASRRLGRDGDPTVPSDDNP